MVTHLVERGQSIFKPRRVPHAFAIAGEEPVRFLELITPAGFERHFHFHVLRHAACGNMYRASGRDIRLTQRFARHKSVVTTAMYTHPSDEELLGAVQSLLC